MKRKRLVIIIFSFLAAVILGALLWPHEREPEYNGVLLSEWLERFNAGRTSVDTNGVWSASAAYHAIDQIGTNALPFLVRWIQYERPTWRQRFYDACWNLPRNIFFNRTYSRLITLGDGNHRAELAAEGFEILGQRARPAIPELRRLARGYSRKYTASRAIGILYLLNDDSASEILVKARGR